MGRKFLGVAAFALASVAVFGPVPLAAQQPAPQVDAARIQQIASNLKPQHGKISLPEAKATLDLGTAYDFYGAADARSIIVDIWGNPPSAGQGVLGLVMPAGKSPLSDAWGAVITYEDSGYVADDDAASTDFGELLTQLQEGEEEDNKQRQADGYPTMHLVGWAEQPSYDKASHSVVWARDLKVSSSPVDGLNYDARTLGRNGVLSVNLISSMQHLGEVKLAAHEFASHVKFDPGARYEDYQAGIDKKAEYGIGGLVAAGVGLAVAKKLGFLAILLKFLKPILLGVVVAFGALKNKIMGLFGRKKGPLEGV